MIDVIVITGATASGKTSLSFELSKHLDLEIISADSRQVYKYLNIGTAKPSQKELNEIPHHFIDIIDPSEDYSAGQFGDEALITIKEIHSRNKTPLIVGGSGLYVKALCEGLFEEVKSEDRNLIRDNLNERLIDNGIEDLYSELMEVDPESAKLYNDKNPRRIIKALEHFRITGEKLSESWESNNTLRDELNAIYFAIDHDREILYDRINKRTELMWENGLVEETKNVLEIPYSKDLNSLNTVGYKEVIAYLDGKMSKEEAIEEMKKNTRRYAKRQLTWCRNQIEDLNWLNPKSALKEMLNILKM